jgi:hypothetical protein
VCVFIVLLQQCTQTTTKPGNKEMANKYPNKSTIASIYILKNIYVGLQGNIFE